MEEEEVVVAEAEAEEAADSEKLLGAHGSSPSWFFGCDDGEMRKEVRKKVSCAKNSQSKVGVAAVGLVQLCVVRVSWASQN